MIMIEEDYRYVSCGGDPFTFIKSAIKSMKIQLEPGQEGKIIVMKEKFPYSRDIFKAMAAQNKMDLEELLFDGEEMSLVFIRNPD